MHPPPHVLGTPSRPPNARCSAFTALCRIALHVNDLLGEINGPYAPYLKNVDPCVLLRRRRQGHVLAEIGDAAAFSREGNAIGVKRDLLSILRGHLCMNVELEAAVCADPQVVNSRDSKSRHRPKVPDSMSRSREHRRGVPSDDGDQL